MRIRTAGRLWHANLIDDGTLDTVIAVQPHDTSFRVYEAHFDSEYASTFRKKTGELTLSGFRQLALDAIDAYPYISGASKLFTVRKEGKLI